MDTFDWTLSRQGYIELVRVDKDTKEEIETISRLKDGSLDINLNTELKVSGDFEVDNLPDIGDDLIRVYIDATDQNQNHIRHALATLYAACPSDTIQPTGVRANSVVGYSTLLRLKEDALKETLIIPQNIDVLAYVKKFVEENGFQALSLDSSYTNSSQLQFDAGTEKLTVVNELLELAGFASARVDAYGNIIFVKNADLSNAKPNLTLRDDETSIIYGGIGHEHNWFSTPNVVICVCTSQDNHITSDPVINNDPNDKYSVINRGREIVRVEEYADINSKEALNEKAQLLAKTSAQRIEKYTLSCAYTPLNIGDVVRLELDSAQVYGNFIAQSFSIKLTQSLKTTLNIRRFV